MKEAVRWGCSFTQDRPGPIQRGTPPASAVASDMDPSTSEETLYQQELLFSQPPTDIRVVAAIIAVCGQRRFDGTSTPPSD
ncbi:hypothetical protein CMUS01_00725 [Colletotrichum musicola]|uniref:Uncharacterized protein n=1 Tax=Colletotrichum musicola TaxID=2175873 RepID=A0A8H6U978_9PEZI|nr:hypothetical protein CMUS01_00725 [Colletotrichum musicola]